MKYIVEVKYSEDEEVYFTYFKNENKIVAQKNDACLEEALYNLMDFVKFCSSKYCSTSEDLICVRIDDVIFGL